jgi:hypothetical protein
MSSQAAETAFAEADQASRNRMATNASAEFNGAALALGRRPIEGRDARLSAATIDWLEALPFGVRPLQLPVDFIRIANELTRLWNDPVELDRYFSEQESDHRGGRIGFPPLVGEELNALHTFSVRRRFGSQ